jgi:hypothetical protein
MIKFAFIPKKLFGTWQFSKLVFWSILSLRLKSKHYSQFFWRKVNLRGLRGFILYKVQASVVERQKKSSATDHSALGKKTLL